MSLAEKLYLTLVLISFGWFFGLLILLSWLDRRADRRPRERAAAGAEPKGASPSPV